MCQLWSNSFIKSKNKDDNKMNNMKNKILSPILFAVSVFCFLIIRLNRSKKKLEQKITDMKNKKILN